MLDVVIATGNTHKARELKRLIAVPGIRFRSLADFPDVPAARESGRTFQANARLKALAVARATGHFALADDSGLEVQALGWTPGIRSARFSGRHGNDRTNNAKLLRLLKGMPPRRRRARYQCALALAAPTGIIALTYGTWHGRIALEPRGRGGFGYDPLFLVPRLGKTVGELPASVKATLSHRAIAARRMGVVLRRLARRTR